MAYCSNCGNQLVDGSKFCNNCGTAVDSENNNQRKTVYDGEIHKCPNCGEVLSSFVTVCPACSYELRGAKASNSVRELAIKLQQIESGRTSKSNNILGRGFGFKQPDDIDEQKINLIKSFAIPNTKEDILEFAVLAASNVDRNAYDESYGYLSQRMNARRRDVSNAWMSKLEQAYQKAKIVLAGDPRLNEIQALYDSTHKSVNKVKWRTWKLVGIIYGVLFAIIAVILIIVFTSTAISEKKEIERLESIEEKIEIALNDEDYKYALMNADSLIFDGGDAELKRDWEIKRNYWIDKIIEEAAEDGIVLERPADVNESEEDSTPTFDLTKENSIGATQYEFKYDNFLEVKKELEGRGFTNVKTQGMQDLKTDWMSQDGTVDKVTVDGETGFPADIAFPLDVEIVIYYHSFKD